MTKTLTPEQQVAADGLRARITAGVDKTDTTLYVIKAPAARLRAKGEWIHPETKEEIPIKPFGMFGVEFKEGIGFTPDKALADRISAEFPGYTVEEAS